MGSIARQIVDEHLELCLAAGINHEGINAEVAKGQWEFQIFGKGSHKAADDVWVARYLMMRLCEKYEVDVQLYCKPIKGDWNGSGMHTNFSTKHLRDVGGKEYFEGLMKAFENNISAHIEVYGPDNHLRLTGLHETQAIDKFSYGLSRTNLRPRARSRRHDVGHGDVEVGPSPLAAWPITAARSRTRRSSRPPGRPRQRGGRLRRPRGQGPRPGRSSCRGPGTWPRAPRWP